MNIWNRFNEQYLLVVGSIILSVALLISGCTGGESRSFPPSGSEASGESTSDYVRTIGQEDAQLPISFNLEDRDLETYKGLPVGFTEQGYPFRGDPNAPITLVEYSDYLCPFCGRHFNQTLPALIESYGETGEVNFVFRDFPLASLHPTAPLGHAAALCVAEQGPALYWEMHDTLFANQGQWNQPGDPSGYLNGLADSIGVDMDAYNDCVAAGNTSALVNQSVSEIQGLGFGGTPSFQVMDGQTGQIYLLVGAQPLQVFANMLDTLLAGEQPPDAQTQAAEASQVTFDVDDEMATYQGLPAGFTEEGYPFLGNPEATISLVEFSDYLCPFCGRHFNQTYPALIQSYGASGEVNFVFRDLPLASLHPTAHYGHEAALCAGEQGAELFWAMHDQLFATQNQWANLPDPTGFVAGLAEGIGVDMKAYDSCIANGQTRAQIEERVAEGRALGFTGTPTFQVLVNDTGDVHEVTGAQPLQIFSDMLDALIAGQDIPESDEPDQGELPLWARPEGLAPDPDRPGYTVAGDQYKGNPDARLVVIEFTDFQCPACQQHALEIQPVLDEQFITSGQALWVFKHLPLKEHPHAAMAAVAAECAAEQGYFWEMHHQLFETIDDWSGDESEAAFMAVAESVGLDMDAFQTCFNSRQPLDRVLSDLYDAQGTVQSTPTFIILDGLKGNVLRGSRPVDEFARLLLGFLENVNDSDTD